MNCAHCNRFIENKGGLAYHTKVCKLNPNRVPVKRSPLAGAKKGNIPWNKGLKNDDRCKISEERKEYLRKISTGHAKTPELELIRRQKIKEYASKHNGGYRRGSGRSKSGWYKDYYCDSSYELVFLIYCLEHNIDIKRNHEKFPYTFKNEIRNYIPDFIVDGKIIEIKGYSNEQTEAKHDAYPEVIVYFKKDIEYMFNYVIEKYGKNFINLYENDSNIEKRNKRLANRNENNRVKRREKNRLKNIEKYGENYKMRRRLSPENKIKYEQLRILKIKETEDKVKFLNDERHRLLKESGLDVNVYGFMSKLAKLFNIKNPKPWLIKHRPDLIPDTKEVRLKENNIICEECNKKSSVSTYSGRFCSTKCCRLNSYKQRRDK